MIIVSYMQVNTQVGTQLIGISNTNQFFFICELVTEL